MAVETSFLLGLLVGLLVAFCAALIFLSLMQKKSKLAQAMLESANKQLHETILKKTSELAMQAERAAQLDRIEQELKNSYQNLAHSKEENSRLMATVASLEVEKNKSAEYLEARIRDLSLVHEHMKKAFAEASQETLLANASLIKTSFNQSMEHFFKASEQERSQSQELLANIMNPLKESLNSVNTKVSELESKRQGAYDGLKEQIEGLLKSQTVLQKEANNLSRALYAPITRGRWGEMQLKRVVELSGLSSHCDFVEQASLKAEGEVLRPDMIVTMPKNKKIVIDAKAPLEFHGDSAFENEEESQKLAAALRRHLLALKKKSYHQALGETPEFVVMFLPGEAFLHRALAADPTLLDFAAQNEILITTPITLVGLLKAIAFGFSQETIANNIEEVRRLSQQLIDRIAKVTQHFEKLGRSIKQSTEAYNQTLASLDSRVLVTARKLASIKSVAKDAHDITECHVPMIDVMPVTVSSHEGDTDA